MPYCCFASLGETNVVEESNGLKKDAHCHRKDIPLVLFLLALRVTTSGFLSINLEGVGGISCTRPHP